VVEPANPVPIDARHADIRFENVDFNYGDKPVLRGINLTAKAGQFVALVGQTGSGKTTITNLLLRFYDPQRGTVRIGGTDIRQVSIKELRRQIALVTQETILFHDTIRQNIAVGRPGATDAEIEAAARAANAHEFIAQRTGGYDSLAGEKGVNVSGGQRQRIAIARDSEVERAVQAELEKLMKGRTTFCIAHRLSTIQKADVIVVLQEGRIVETGTHTELLQRNGVYKRLYELQFNA
jgi:subfamily B ATP-binding cassette protein MsbA